MLEQTERIPMFLKPKRVRKDGKTHTYWVLVESVRTPKGPRHRTVAYLASTQSPYGYWDEPDEILDHNPPRWMLPGDDRYNGHSPFGARFQACRFPHRTESRPVKKCGPCSVISFGSQTLR